MTVFILDVFDIFLNNKHKYNFAYYEISGSGSAVERISLEMCVSNLFL